VKNFILICISYFCCAAPAQALECAQAKQNNANMYKVAGTAKEVKTKKNNNIVTSTATITIVSVEYDNKTHLMDDTLRGKIITVSYDGEDNYGKHNLQQEMPVVVYLPKKVEENGSYNVNGCDVQPALGAL